jgi:Ig-like domain from next to BRCA1 gene
VNTQPETLDSYVRQRAQTLGLSVVQVCKAAGVSRQTFYTLAQIPERLPQLQTIVSLAQVLQVHPLRLLHLVFQSVPLGWAAQQTSLRGDQSAFIGDVTIPEGTLMTPNERFTKTWELQNVGLVPWAGRQLRCADADLVVFKRDGELMQVAMPPVPDAPVIDVPFTAPGDHVRLSMVFTAPALPGTYLSYWKSYFADGTLCFPNSAGLQLKVQVMSVTTGAHEPLRRA